MDTPVSLDAEDIRNEKVYILHISVHTQLLILFWYSGD